jgi:uncharacterized membrane protein
MDINAGAPVITRDEIVINAPIDTIWDIQTDLPSWPSWQPDVDGAQTSGPLAVGSVFRWQTATGKSGLRDESLLWPRSTRQTSDPEAGI